MGIHHSDLHEQGQHDSTKGFQLKTIMLISLNTQHQCQSEVTLAVRGSPGQITKKKKTTTQNTLGSALISLLCSTTRLCYMSDFKGIHQYITHSGSFWDHLCGRLGVLQP